MTVLQTFSLMTLAVILTSLYVRWTWNCFEGEWHAGFPVATSADRAPFVVLSIQGQLLLRARGPLPCLFPTLPTQEATSWVPSTATRLWRQAACWTTTTGTLWSSSARAGASTSHWTGARSTSAPTASSTTWTWIMRWAWGRGRGDGCRAAASVSSLCWSRAVVNYATPLSFSSPKKHTYHFKAEFINMCHLMSKLLIINTGHIFKILVPK